MSRRKEGEIRQKVAELKKAGVSAAETAKKLGVTVANVYYHWNALKKSELMTPSGLSEELSTIKAKIAELQMQEQELLEAQALKVTRVDTNIRIERMNEALTLPLTLCGELIAKLQAEMKRYPKKSKIWKGEI